MKLKFICRRSDSLRQVEYLQARMNKATYQLSLNIPEPASPVFQARRFHSVCWGTTLIHSRVRWVLAPPQRQCSAPSPGIRAPVEIKSTDTSPRSGEQRITAIISKRVWNAERTYCFVWNLERQSASFNKPGGGVNLFQGVKNGTNISRKRTLPYSLTQKEMWRALV